MINLSDIVVTIKDKEALNMIEPDQLKTFLIDNEFVEYQELEDGNGMIYQKYQNTYHNTVRVVQLYSQDDPSYTITMASNLMHLEQVLGKTQLQMFLDITDNELIMFSEKKQRELNEEVENVMKALSND